MTIHAQDVAAYILRKRGPMSAMKLQKLVYYCQAWSLVWDDRPMFPERIEAWVNGPVVPDLYARHRGQYQVNDVMGDPSSLDERAVETVEAVLDAYGHLSADDLSATTHSEAPWIAAREGLDDHSRSGRVIELDRMAEYYSSLPHDGQESQAARA